MRGTFDVPYFANCRYFDSSYFRGEDLIMFYNVYFCLDCHLAAHGYTAHETGRDMPIVSTRYTDNSFCDDIEAEELHPGEYCEGDCYENFSWNSCDNENCLGPDLGGTRYRYAYWAD